MVVYLRDGHIFIGYLRTLDQYGRLFAPCVHHHSCYLSRKYCYSPGGGTNPHREKVLWRPPRYPDRTWRKYNSDWWSGKWVSEHLVWVVLFGLLNVFFTGVIVEFPRKLSGCYNQPRCIRCSCQPTLGGVVCYLARNLIVDGYCEEAKRSVE